MIYWFGVIGGFLMGFATRGLIQNFIENRIKFHQNKIREIEMERAATPAPEAEP